MIRALESALGGFAARSEEISRLAERIRGDSKAEQLVGNLTGMMANQRGAEANLVAARVVNDTWESLVHVVA